MNSHLEQAIQQAMAELDKQTLQQSAVTKLPEKETAKQTKSKTKKWHPFVKLGVEYMRNSSIRLL